MDALMLDGNARFLAVQPVQGYPLVVNTALTETAAFAAWNRRAALIGSTSLNLLHHSPLPVGVCRPAFVRIF
mgnify:CR=1 FL=1